MKKLSKIFYVSLLVAVISGGIKTQVYAYTYTPVPNSVEEPSVWPQSDIIEWRYKTENGKLYKRQYNYTKVKWIGDWK
ncbi:hypothetical protein [Clostridium sp. Marseille-P2415]|uniref:hypothetical protein n=1 Tax=Clostridium sp. Marseille-P2415 TaxID=1805471 RepID=UPI0009888F7F|nr:hypothetical protein [Clostridium sp. Marseille-P2415]